MKIILTLSLLTLTLFSCQKIEDKLEKPGASNTVPSSSTSYETGIQPMDAIGRRGEVVMILDKALGSYYMPFVCRLTLDGGVDAEGYPRLKMHSSTSIAGYDNEAAAERKSALSRWGERLFAFVPKQTGLKEIRHIACYELRCPEDSYAVSCHKIGTIDTYKGGTKIEISTIAVTEFQGRMYAVAENKEGYLELLRTTSEDSSVGSVGWEFVSTIKAEGNLVWDAVYDLTSVLVPTADGSVEEQLYLGRVAGYQLDIFRFNDENSEWTRYTKPGFENNDGSFKLEVGELQNSGQDNSEVAIQAIYSEGSKVLATAFYPTNNAFGTTVNLKNHNGSMAAASVASPIFGNTLSGVPAAYQQHIYVMQGQTEITEKLDIDRYTSSIIYSRAISSSLLAGGTKAKFLQSASAEKTIEAYLADPDTRQTCALIGIVEGPPPTFVKNQADLDAFLPSVPSQLRLSTSSTEGSTESYQYTLGIFGEITGSNIDFRKLKAFKGFSIGIGVDISGTKYNDITITKTNALDMVFNSTIHAHDNATLLYIIPVYTLYDYYYSNSEKKDYYPISVTSHLSNDDVIVYAKSVDISKPPFSVSDPMDLTQWQNRFSSNVTTGSRKTMSLSYTFPSNLDISKSFEKTTEENRGWAAREQVKISAEALFKIVDIKAGVYGDCTQGQNFSCNMSDQMQMTYYQMDKSIIKGDYGIAGFQCTMHMMFENCEDSKRYYDQLIKDKLMRTDEHPWIIGYQISGIATEQ